MIIICGKGRNILVFVAREILGPHCQPRGTACVCADSDGADSDTHQLEPDTTT